jgi:hypothetical protein
MFSVYDLDQHKGYVNHEYLVFPNPVTNFTTSTNPPTTVNQTGQNDGTLRFASTVDGNLDDNRKKEDESTSRRETERERERERKRERQ